MTKTQKAIISGVIGALTIAGGISILNEKEYQELKVMLVEKQQDWNWCLEKGEIISNEEGVYTGCVLDGITYESFTFQDLQVLAGVVDKEVKRQPDKKMILEIKKEDNLMQKIINKIK